MSKENSRRYLDIPGEKTLVYNFKFNLDLPPPIPQPKTMFVPLDPERYIKPKLTLFHVKRKPVLFTDINLSIPVDEINMKPELWNPAPDAKIELSDKDRELLEEKPIQDSQKKTPQKVAVDAPHSLNRTDSVKEALKAMNNGKVKPLSQAAAKKPEQTSGQKKKEETKKLTLEEYIKRSFEIAKSYNLNYTNPSKEGLKCEEVFDILPDLQNLIQDFHIVKTEVSTDTLKSKENILRFDTDVDKKPILAIYSHKPLFDKDGQDQMDKELKKKKTDLGGIEEEVEGEENGENKEDISELANNPIFKKIENYEHLGNYIFSHPKPIGTAKRDFLLNLKRDEGKAYIYQTQPVLIKKKKVLFANKSLYKDDEDDERKVKEIKKSVKLIKKSQDRDDLLLAKRRFEAYHLEHTKFYKENKELLDNYQEEEDEEELEQIKKKFVKEVEEEEEAEGEGMEEEEDEEGEVGGRGDAIDEEEEEVPEAVHEEDREEDREEDKEDEGEATFGDMAEEKSEAELPEPKKKEGSDDEAAQELADFFEESEDDD